MKFFALVMIAGSIALVGFLIGRGEPVEAPTTQVVAIETKSNDESPPRNVEPQSNKKTSITSMQKITDISYYDEVSAPDPSQVEELPVDTRVVSLSYFKEGGLEPVTSEFYISAPADLDGAIYNGLEKMSKGSDGVIKVKGNGIIEVDVSNSTEGRFLLEVAE